MKRLPGGNWIVTILVMITIGFALLVAPGCNRHTTRAQRQVEKQMRKEEKLAEKEYRKIIKAHEKRQSERTAKMMRDAKKRAKKLNKSRIRK